MSRRRGAKRADAHVRLYAWELKLPSYRTLKPAARALLVEFRSLYTGQENRVFLSVRDMAQRLGISQNSAIRARNELLERGWVKLVQRSGFNRKARIASVYTLTNEAIDDADGATASKEYARWQPAAEPAERFSTASKFDAVSITQRSALAKKSATKCPISITGDAVNPKLAVPQHQILMHR